MGHQNEALLDITKLQIDMTINEYDFCAHDASSVAFACVLNAIESITDDGMFYANVETTMGEVVTADDVGQRMNKTSAKRGVGSSFTMGGNVSKRNSVHSSPRTVAATSISTR